MSDPIQEPTEESVQSEVVIESGSDQQTTGVESDPIISAETEEHPDVPEPQPEPKAEEPEHSSQSVEEVDDDGKVDIREMTLEEVRTWLSNAQRASIVALQASVNHGHPGTGPITDAIRKIVDILQEVRV